MVRNMIRFYGEELLAPHLTPNLEDHPLSTLQDCLFNIFPSTLRIRGRSSIHNLRTRHALVNTQFIDEDCTVILLCFSLISQEPD
jgi:hypothetical protein